MNAVIPFPVPRIERYTIDYDPVTHAVDIPLVPADADAGVSILAVLVDELIAAGTLTGDQVLQVAAQAAGML